MSISAIATNDNITIFFNKETLVINRIKNKNTFDEVLEKIKKNDLAWIEKNINKIKDAIESKTDGVFSVNNGTVMLKGTTVPVPEIIVKKLMELENEKAPILPLLRFWRKLSANPSEESRKDLYTFITKNNIPITEQGDMVLEKGVNQKPKSFPGDLVDAYTGTLNNSIGEHVSMPRDKVNADRNQTCSHGLHVAAPDYVRKTYGSHILIECIVTPMNVVSVPTDYNATKMRVCAYTVVGYSPKDTRDSLKVVKLSDFLNTPVLEQEKKMGGAVLVKETINKVEDAFGLAKKSAREIVEYVKEATGELITMSLKSKKSILRKAEQLLEIHNIKNTNI